MTASIDLSPRGASIEKPAIAIFAFRRADLLRVTLESLERAQGFGQLACHVFSDAARSDVPGEAEAVRGVRGFLRGWCDTHNATLHEAPVNLGLRKSIVGGVTRVLDQHERVIVLEDDLLISPCFLEFMQKALEECRDRLAIMQVSGYFIPHDVKLPPVGLVRSPGSWGWGTWRRAWSHYDDDAAKLLREVSGLDTNAFDFNGSYAFLDALRRNAEGDLDTWAVRWYASMFVRGGLSIYPSRTFTRNIGFRNDATNTGPSRTATAFMNQPIAETLSPIDWSRVGNGETTAYAQTLEAFYRWQHAEWTRPTLRERLHARWNLLTGRDAPA